MSTTTRERPIIFSSPMVRAILAGTKTMTRRVVKRQPEREVDEWVYCYADHLNRAVYSPGTLKKGIHPWAVSCPYGVPGDRLWVRETWGEDLEEFIYYRADDPTNPRVEKWRPPIHMPRWASRITLEITAVRVQRAAVISAEDALAEGIEEYARQNGLTGQWVTAFARLWDEINARRGYPWESNPFVWALSFRRIEC